jgi:membrane-associated two-gene conflict system component 1 (EACC1)
MTPTVVRLITGDPDDLVSLREWLTCEDELRGNVFVERDRARDARTGPAADALVVALGAGGVVTALIRSLPTWLRRHTHVTVEIRDSAGRAVRVSARDDVNVADVVQSALTTTETAGDR